MASVATAELRTRIALQQQMDNFGTDLQCLAIALEAEEKLAPLPPGDAPHLSFARTPSAWPSKGDAMFRPGAGFEEISEHEERTFALLASIPRVQPGPLPSDVLSSAEPPPPWRRHSGSDNCFVEQPMTSIASAASAAPGTSALPHSTTIKGVRVASLQVPPVLHMHGPSPRLDERHSDCRMSATRL